MTGGVIVTLSAVVAEMPTAGMCCLFGGQVPVTAFDAAAVRELRRSGIRLIDVRPPHTETGLAERPIAGTAPSLPAGRDSDGVAARIVAAIRDLRVRDVSFEH
jgi:cyclic-di-GMP-binding biofilm dispersal mediator protein